MSQENVEVMRRYYAAWNADGLDAARAFWSDDFEWHDAPEMAEQSDLGSGRSLALSGRRM